MSGTYRKERLDQLLWQELNNIIVYEMNDPRLTDISVGSVDVSRDLQTARVYIMLLDDDCDEQEVMRALESARGYLRGEIAGRIQLRKVPELYFKIDRSYQQAQRVDEILSSLPPPADPDLPGEDIA